MRTKGIIMKYIVYSDTHKYAPQFTGHTVDGMINERIKVMNEDCEVILTGDIIDAKNCKRWKEADSAISDIQKLKYIFDEKYLLGNHEIEKPSEYVYISNGVLFCHGHIIFWDDDKIKRWENKKVGMNRRKYYSYKIFKAFKKRKNKQLHPSGKHLLKIKELLELHNCHTIVFGHSHRNYDVQYAFGRVINVPQGRTVINVK